MALLKEITATNGVKSCYHRIVGVEVEEWSQYTEVTVKVRSYYNDTYREDERATHQEQQNLESAKAELDSLVANPTEDNEARRIELSELVNATYEAGYDQKKAEKYAVGETTYKLKIEDDDLSRQALYDKLKELPEFENATDV